MIIFHDKCGLVKRLKGWFNIFKSIAYIIEGQKLYNLIRYRNIFSKNSRSNHDKSPDQFITKGQDLNTHNKIRPINILHWRNMKAFFSKIREICSFSLEKLNTVLDLLFRKIT